MRHEKEEERRLAEVRHINHGGKGAGPRDLDPVRARNPKTLDLSV
eukprot:COSAG03_NODE_503_length_7396_cov_5.279704_2_plen_45_part_00